MSDEYDILNLLVKWARDNKHTGVVVNVDTLDDVLLKAQAYEDLVRNVKNPFPREWACERLECDH